MRDQEVHTTRSGNGNFIIVKSTVFKDVVHSVPDVTSLADSDGGEDRYEDERDGGDHDGDGAGQPGLGHDPAGAEEDDDAEDVDEARREHAVPGAEQDSVLGANQQARQPPRRCAGALKLLNTSS